MFEPPQLKFFRFFPNAPAPRRADQSAVGTLPARAFRYCEAVRLAGGWGYWLFPPLSFSVVWDGSQIMWRAADQTEWEPLADYVNFPGFPEAWEAGSPAGFPCPAFLTAMPEPGLLQITLGLIPTTTPGWLLYVRPVANFPGVSHTASYVGLIDSEAYRFGPLFTNLRLCKTDLPITFLVDRPLVQVSAVPRWLLADELMPPVTPIDMSAWSADDWNGYHETIVEPADRPDRRFGEYATRARKMAAACPAHGDAAEAEAGR